jgi:hypothetical protein
LNETTGAEAQILLSTRYGMTEEAAEKAGKADFSRTEVRSE